MLLLLSFLRPIFRSVVLHSKSLHISQAVSYFYVKFIYSEKVKIFCKIFPLLFTVCTVVKSKGKISQNFVAFSEYMNFNTAKKMIFELGFLGSNCVHLMKFKVEQRSVIYMCKLCQALFQEGIS